jgi:N-methylhydantoinase A
VYRRADLAAGQRIDGPAIIEERETTAVVRAGWVATVAADGSVIAERTRGRDASPEASATEGTDR